MYSLTRKKKAIGQEHEEEKIETDDVKFYTKQKVNFVDGDSSYIPKLKKEVDEGNPHFNSLRKLATSSAKGTDFFGVKIEDQIWLFPVSQKHLKLLYQHTQLNGKMESFAFNQAVGYAPKGMPFMDTTDQWKELRKNLAAIFHSNFMDAYLGYFNTAVNDLVTKWKGESGKVLQIKTDICNMAYDSAVYSLTGSKLDVNVPYHGDGTKEMHIRDVNHHTLVDFAKHAATKEFVKDKDYRFKSNSITCDKLNKNMNTLGEALTGLVTARAGQLAEGAEAKLTIVDAAYGLLTQGVIKDVEEAVHHGWAILNGAHNNCGNALSAALYYLLKNPECYNKLKKELDTELFKGKKHEQAELKEIITRESLKDLEYLSYVVKETLRLSSPIYGKPMRVKEDMELEEGFKVKKGTVIYPNNGVLGVSENIWKNPLEFIPERFDPESEYFKLPQGGKREPIVWLAFGSGPRQCMGDNYSMYFMKVGLAYFLHLFTFELKEDNATDGFFYWLTDKQFTAKVNSI